MHITQRFIFGAIALLLVVPSAVFAISSDALQERQEYIHAIQNAKAGIGGTDVSAEQVQEQKERSLQQMQKKDLEMREITNEKRDVRLELMHKMDELAKVRQDIGVDPANAEQVLVLIQRQKESAQAFAKLYTTMWLQTEYGVNPMAKAVLPALIGTEYEETYYRLRALSKARLLVMDAISKIVNLPKQVADLQEEHKQLLGQYHASLGEYEGAKQEVELSDAQLAEIKDIVEKVEYKIRQLQSELSRYDEEIRLRIEKELVARGLRAPRPGGYSMPVFIWPVVGRITAGFFEPSYQRYFGIPHKAIDISQPQGSIVHSAATGIVYHVQHGGAYGYSYVLVGHRGGYATLYGHLSVISVEAGEEVDQGGVIGFSGGTPGTVGAGPMTTGPHLHFEVIKEGEHVDPRTVLP